MALKRMDSYTLICDWPGCGVDVLEGHDYSGFGDTAYLYEIAGDAGWWLNDPAPLRPTDERLVYCNEHPAEWEADHEDGDLYPYPQTPFLLLHENGDVTLMNGAEA